MAPPKFTGYGLAGREALTQHALAAWPEWIPKGPFRTKKTTAIAKIVKLLSRSVFTTPPKFTTPQTLLGEGKCL